MSYVDRALDNAIAKEEEEATEAKEKEYLEQRLIAKKRVEESLWSWIDQRVQRIDMEFDEFCKPLLGTIDIMDPQSAPHLAVAYKMGQRNIINRLVEDIDDICHLGVDYE